MKRSHFLILILALVLAVVCFFSFNRLTLVVIPDETVGIATAKDQETALIEFATLTDLEKNFQILRPGKHLLDLNKNKVQLYDKISISDNYQGVVERLQGRSVPEGKLLAEAGERGILKTVLKSGVYYFLPNYIKIHLYQVEGIEIKIGEIGVIKSAKKEKLFLEGTTLAKNEKKLTSGVYSTFDKIRIETIGIKAGENVKEPLIKDRSSLLFISSEKGAVKVYSKSDFIVGLHELYAEVQKAQYDQGLWNGYIVTKIIVTKLDSGKALANDKGILAGAAYPNHSAEYVVYGEYKQPEPDNDFFSKMRVNSFAIPVVYRSDKPFRLYDLFESLYYVQYGGIHPKWTGIIPTRIEIEN